MTTGLATVDRPQRASFAAIFRCTPGHGLCFIGRTMKRAKIDGEPPSGDLDERWREAGRILRERMPGAFEAMLAAAESALAEIACRDEPIGETYH